MGLRAFRAWGFRVSGFGGLGFRVWGFRDSKDLLPVLSSLRPHPGEQRGCKESGLALRRLVLKGLPAVLQGLEFGVEGFRD